MGRQLFDQVEAARAVFTAADAALDEALSHLCFAGPEEELKQTANTQPAILTTSIAALRALEERGIRADFVAGHSLGEYSALVAAGALDFADAVRLVRQRGRFMQEAVPQGEGAMAALLGGDLEIVTAVCREASAVGVCAPANLNSPTQVVIAGSRVAIERAVNLAKERGIRRAVMLAVSAPFHCELMRPAAERLQPLLAATSFADLRLPLVTNVDAEWITSGIAARDALFRQVAAPVRWTDSVQRLLAAGVTVFIEVGPGTVLSGLVKNLRRDVKTLNVESLETLDATVAALS